MKLYTVGYEGCDIEEFTATLKKKGIKQIVDVRKNPVSRKKGFSKNKMAEALAVYKIDYLHLPGLGVPTEWRKKAKAELITRKKMFKDYVQKILPKQGDDIALITKMMKKKKLALLCYEEDATDCHRTFVAHEVQAGTRPKVEIVNLMVREVGPKLFRLKTK